MSTPLLTAGSECKVAMWVGKFKGSEGNWAGPMPSQEGAQLERKGMMSSCCRGTPGVEKFEADETYGTPDLNSLFLVNPLSLLLVPASTLPLLLI